MNIESGNFLFEGVSISFVFLVKQCYILCIICPLAYNAIECFNLKDLNEPSKLYTPLHYCFIQSVVVQVHEGFCRF